MTGIASFSGLASGVEWADLVDKLIDLEKARKLGPLTREVDAQQARRDKWSSYEGLLSKLSTASLAIKDQSAFGYLKTAATTSPVGSKTLISASASSSAVPGSYQVEVIKLATADKLSGGAFASTSTQLGVAGDFYVNGRKVSITATDSLTAVRDKINAVNSGTTASGVTATILSTSSTEHRLVLTSDATGSRGIELTDGSTNALESLGIATSTTVRNSNATNSANTDSNRFSSKTTSLASMLGVTAPPAVTTILIDGQKITVDLQNDTLLSIMNKVATAGGTAEITEEVVDGDTFYRLTTTGTASADPTASDTAASQEIVELLGFENKARASSITTGQDSSFRIDGFAMNRRTNTVSDAVNGVTLNLLTANGSDRTASISGSGLSIDTNPNTFGAGTYAIGMTHTTNRATSTSDPSLSVASAPGTTSAGTYDVNITQAASVASVTGSGFDGTYSKAIGSDTMTVTDGSGNGATITMNAFSTTTSIIDDLNTEFTNNGATLVASNVGGQVHIESTTAKGSSSTFTITTSHANVQGQLGIAPGTYNGTNVAGTIGGIAATGSGETLTGSSGAVNGLQVQYTGTATGSPVGTVTVTDTDTVTGVTINGEAAVWDSATSTIRGATDSDFEGLVLGYSGAPTTGQIGTLTVSGEIAVTLDISRDFDATIVKMNEFAAAYNATVDFYESQRGNISSPLYGNGTLRSLQRSLTASLLAPVTGLASGSTYTRGAIAGVALDDEGHLQVDAETLKSAMQTDLKEIRALFSTNGTSSDGQVKFVDGTDATQPGSYAINITTAATQASHTGSVWGGTYTASDGVSDTLQITDSVSGQSVDFVATQGMTLSEAIVELTELFENNELSLTAVDDGGALKIISADYGTAATFTLAGTEAATRLGLTEATYAGVDVAGTIGGLAATGEGQVLTGGTGEVTEGLSIRYSGSDTGSKGTVDYVLGVTGNIDAVLSPIIRAGDGTVALQLESIDASIDRLNLRADSVEARLAVRQQSLEQQFIRMEEALGMLNAQSQWLSSQITALNPPQ